LPLHSPTHCPHHRICSDHCHCRTASVDLVAAIAAVVAIAAAVTAIVLATVAAVTATIASIAVFLASATTITTAATATAVIINIVALTAAIFAAVALASAVATTITLIPVIANAAAFTAAIVTAIALATTVPAIINNTVNLISAIAPRHCLSRHCSLSHCHCCRCVAITIAIAALPSPPSGHRHTYSVLFAAICCILIVDCFFPFPQLFELATAATAAAAPMFIGPPMCLQRWKSARDASFTIQTRLSYSLSHHCHHCCHRCCLCAVQAKLSFVVAVRGGGAAAMEGNG
jgi:hypothetical protein